MLKRAIHPFGVCAAICLIALFSVGDSYLVLFEQQLDKLWYLIHTDSFIENRIAIIEIDDQTLEKYMPEIPMPRDQIALLIDDLAGPIGDAKTIIIDLYFEGPDKYDPDNDYLLASMLSIHSDKLVNSMFLPISSGYYRTLPAGACLDRFDYNVDNMYIPVSANPELPLSEFLCNSDYYGHLDIDYGEFNTPKSLPLFVRVDTVEIGAISLEAIRNFLDIDVHDIKISNRELSIGGYKIPFNYDGTINIKYVDNPYKTYSLLDISNQINAGTFEEGFFKDKIVLIGIKSDTYYPKEFFYTPLGGVRPNVYLHADMISNILNDSFLRSTPEWFVGFFLLFTFIWFVSIYYIKRRFYRVGLGLFILILYLVIDLICFQVGYITEIMPSLLAGIVLAVYTEFYTVREQKKIIEEQAVEVTVLKEREKSLIALEQELKVARAIQKNMLPQVIPSHSKYDFYGVNTPAKNVSGDFYDFINMPDEGLTITIGDVSGKGISAAMVMVASQAVIRSESMKHQSLDFNCSELLTIVNNQLQASTDPNIFVTSFYALLDMKTDELKIINAGHNPPYLIEPNQPCEELDTGGLLLGVIPDANYESQTIKMAPNQKVVIFTDGITEAENKSGEMFGEERLKNLLCENVTLSSKELTNCIIDNVNRFSEGIAQSDDMTIVIIGKK